MLAAAVAVAAAFVDAKKSDGSTAAMASTSSAAKGGDGHDARRAMRTCGAGADDDDDEEDEDDADATEATMANVKRAMAAIASDTLDGGVRERGVDGTRKQRRRRGLHGGDEERMRPSGSMCTSPAELSIMRRASSAGSLSRPMYVSE
jgi:hypothetical protein